MSAHGALGPQFGAFTTEPDLDLDTELHGGHRVDTRHPWSEVHRGVRVQRVSGRELTDRARKQFGSRFIHGSN